MSHDWNNNTIIIQGTSTVRTILVIKNFGAPIKRLEMLICYDFHSRIFDEEGDLMFATEPRLFLIGTITILTLVWLDQPIKLITSVGLNLVKHVNKLVEPMSEPPISSNIPMKLVPIRLVKIGIPLDTFNNIYQRHFSNLK
jgi:hypothetical protein